MAYAFTGKEMLISGDDHMSEPPDLWEKGLPAKFKDQAPRNQGTKLLESRLHMRPGGWDGNERLKDMDVDGVSAVVLYQTDGQQVWRTGPSAGGTVELEQACARVYNDFMIEHCSANLERLWGLGMMTLYDIDWSIAELERCKAAGLRGASIWIAAPHELPYSSEHYEKFWAAAADMNMPLGMHISARSERRPADPPGLGALHSVNGHKFDAMESLGHMIGGGVFERHPKLQVSVAEIGVGWVPFWLQEMDYYTSARSRLPKAPSEYFRTNVTSTFIGDAVGGQALTNNPLLQDISLWSADYPHVATIWPDSRNLMEEDLGHLNQEIIHKVIYENSCRVFNEGKTPPPANDPDPDYAAYIRSWVKEHPQFGVMSRERNAPEAGRVLSA
jgi:predicted TIM-barrel fold metal-dependent hydrolase